LNAYRAGTRVNMIMRTIANKMSAEEIKAVSEYVQGLH
jgi:cytochrome c553